MVTIRSLLLQSGLVLTGLVLTISVPASSTTYPDQGCVTEECHAQVGEAEFVHGPVGAQICTVCHASVSGREHEFQLVAEGETLCLGCHESKSDVMLEAHVHTPVARGNCIGCHDPHQSDFRYTLRAEGDDLCFVCHDSEPFQAKTVHGPVARGDCNACHNPHASPHVHQLNAAPEKLCFTCHAEQSDTPGRRHSHQPVTESCLKCHSPHASSSRSLLAKDPPNLCFDCHGEIVGHLSLEYQHAPVAAGLCDECHDVHGSEYPMLFPRPQMELCLSCHDDLADYLEQNAVLHGPVKEGDCSACHDPHGSSYYRILRKYFPEEFYMPYDPTNYAICFDCHNQNVATDAKTDKLTDFRDGTTNLHYLHVNKEVKGRSCKACHEAHASTQTKHVRETVPFGEMNWDLPVKFTKGEDGGGCVVGCHAPKNYRR